MSSTLRKRRVTTAAALAALGAAVTSAAVAGIPDAAGVVTACQTQRGDVRFADVEGGQTCNAKETSVRLAGVDAAGKVRDADRLDGLDASRFTRVAHSETVEVDYGNLDSAGECVQDGIQVPDGISLGRPVLVSAEAPFGASGFILSAGSVIETPGEVIRPAAVWNACNITGAPIPPIDVHITVLG